MYTYKQFNFRAPDIQTFLQDVKQVCADNGIDAVERGVVKESEDGTLEPGFGIDAIPAGQWYETDPTYNDDGTVKTEGTLGDYALFNVLTKDDDLIALAEQFTKTDPSLSPSEVPADEQIGSGTHRIDGSQIDSPARTW